MNKDQIFLTILLAASSLPVVKIPVYVFVGFIMIIHATRLSITPTLQKPEGFRVKASESEVVVLYFEPSATQNLKSSGFPEGETTW